MLHLVEQNPDLEKFYISQLLGIKLPDAEDPVERVKREKLAVALANDEVFMEQVKQEYLNSQAPDVDMETEVDRTVNEAVLLRIQSNPQILEKLAEKRIEALTHDRRKGSPLADAVEELAAAEELTERLGLGKRSDKLITPEVIDSFMKNVVPLILGGRAESRQTYVVETPQGIREMNVVDYKAYLEQKTRAQLPAPKATTPPKPPTEQPISLYIDEWLPYLEQEPESLALVLKARAGEDSQVALAVNFLRTHTAEQVLTLISPFKSQGGTVEQVISHLENNPAWLTGLIVALKEEIP